MRRLSATLVLLSLAAGCATAPPPAAPPISPPKPAPPPGPTPPVLEGGWRLMFLDGISGALAPGQTLKLARDAASGGLSATGFGGCGEYASAATRTGVSIQFQSVVPAPKEGCETAIRALESQFVTALTTARRLTIRGGYLVLMDESGRDRAYFVPG